MTSAFPSGLDNFTDPTDADFIQNTENPEVDLANLISNHNDALEKIQAAIGITNSAVTSSVQYRLNNLGAAAIGVREMNTTVVAAAGTLDFRLGFDITDQGSGVARVVLDASEVSGDPQPLAIGSAMSIGTSTDFANRHHVHAMPSFGATNELGAATVDGALTSVANAGHVHKRRVGVKVGGTDVGNRKDIDLVAGTGISLTQTPPVDDAANDKVVVTVSNTAPGSTTKTPLLIWGKEGAPEVTVGGHMFAVRGNWTLTDFVASCDVLSGVGNANRYDLNRVNPTTRVRTSLLAGGGTTGRPNLVNVYEAAGSLSTTSISNGDILSVDVDSVSGPISDVTLILYATPA